MPVCFIKSFFRRLYYRALLILYRGNRVHCPVCGTSLARFRNVNRQRSSPNGNVCPKCRSFERQRLLWLFLRDNTGIFSTKCAKTLLHVAPEPCLRKKFEEMTLLRYIVADLQSTDADEKIDITNMSLSDDSVDFIVCSHVLEHVPDDGKAMRELRRVLKPEGWAVINVPVDYAREQTHEDASITTPVQRKIHFGQADHVRVYGRDYPLRLAEAGFIVKEIDLARKLGREAVERHVLSTDEMIYFCTR